MAGPGQVRAGRAYVELGVDDRMAAGLAKASRRLRAFGRQAQAVGMGMMKIGALVAAPLAIGVKAYADFEQQMAFVSTMLGKDAPKYMDRYSQAIKDMAVASGESTATLAKGLYDLLSAQIAAGDALDVLNVAMKAAIGGNTDVATSTKALVRVLKSYALEASQAADVSDVLFRVVEKGVITYAELAEHIGTVAPSARAAGLSLDELAAAIATVVAIEEPARAMTALRQAIFEAAEEGEDFLTFIRRFEGADLTKIIEAGIPKRAALGVVILSQNLELLDENLAAMTDRAGAADRAYEAMAGTLKRDFLRILQALKVAFAEIGDALAGNVKDATTRILEIIKTTTDWIKKNRELIVQIAKWTVRLIAAGAALWALGAAAKAAAVAIGILRAAVLIATSPIGALAMAVLALGAAFLWTSEAGKSMRKITGEELALMAKNSRAVIDNLIAYSKYRGVAFCEDVRHFFCVVIPAYVKWGVQVCGDILRDLWKQLKLDIAIAGKNLSNFMCAVRDVMLTGKWKFEWTPFEHIPESAIRELPEIAAREMSWVEKALHEELEKARKELEREFELSVGVGIETNEFEDALDRMKRAMEDFQETAAAGGLPGMATAGRALPAARGTFNPLAVLGLQTTADRPIKRMADGIDRLNETQRRALREAMKAGYVFS